MRDIALTQAQIDDLVQRLKGSKTLSSARYAEALVDAGILAPGASLEAIGGDSLRQLEGALSRCDKCQTYQPTADMEHANDLTLCRVCVGSLTYRQVSGG